MRLLFLRLETRGEPAEPAALVPLKRLLDTAVCVTSHAPKHRLTL